MGIELEINEKVLCFALSLFKYVRSCKEARSYIGLFILVRTAQEKESFFMVAIVLSCSEDEVSNRSKPNIFYGQVLLKSMKFSLVF